MRKPLLRQPSSVSSATDYNDPADRLSAEDSALRLPGYYSSAKALPSPLSFQFHGLRTKIDWRVLHGIDVDELVRTTDIDTLERCVNAVAYGDLEAEGHHGLTQVNFIRIFRLGQLTAQYLLHVQDSLARDTARLRAERNRACKHVQAVRGAFAVQREKLVSLRKEAKTLNRAIKVLEAQLNERPPVPAPGVPPEIAAQLQSLREEARALQEERVKLHAELARLQQAMQSLQTPKGDDVGPAVAAAVASARQHWDLERQQLLQRHAAEVAILCKRISELEKLPVLPPKSPSPNVPPDGRSEAQVQRLEQRFRQQEVELQKLRLQESQGTAAPVPPPPNADAAKEEARRRQLQQMQAEMDRLKADRDLARSQLDKEKADRAEALLLRRRAEHRPGPPLKSAEEEHLRLENLALRTQNRQLMGRAIRQAPSPPPAAPPPRAASPEPAMDTTWERIQLRKDLSQGRMMARGMQGDRDAMLQLPQPTQSLPLMQRDPRLVDDYPERLSMTHRVMSQPDLSQQGTTLPRKKSWLARTFSRKKKSIASAGSVASGSPAGSPVKTISAFDATYGPTFQPLASALSSPAGSPFAAVTSPMARAGSGLLPGASFTPVGSPLRHQSTLPPLPEESPPISYRDAARPGTAAPRPAAWTPRPAYQHSSQLLTQLPQSYSPQRPSSVPDSPPRQLQDSPRGRMGTPRSHYEPPKPRGYAPPSPRGKQDDQPAEHVRFDRPAHSHDRPSAPRHSSVQDDSGPQAAGPRLYEADRSAYARRRPYGFGSRAAKADAEASSDDGPGSHVKKALTSDTFMETDKVGDRPASPTRRSVERGSFAEGLKFRHPTVVAKPEPDIIPAQYPPSRALNFERLKAHTDNVEARG